MVARYATHHRSLYPHLELVRDHFLLTSHAGVPVAVWDRRWVPGQMGWLGKSKTQVCNEKQAEQQVAVRLTLLA